MHRRESFSRKCSKYISNIALKASSRLLIEEPSRRGCVIQLIRLSLSSAFFNLWHCAWVVSSIYLLFDLSVKICNMFISIDVSYYLVFVYLWSSARDDRRKHRTEGRIFDADWQEIHSRQRKSESGPGRNLKVAPRNIVWRAEEIQVWREIWLALIFVCRVFKYRYSKYSHQGEGEKRVRRHNIF